MWRLATAATSAWRLRIQFYVSLAARRIVVNGNEKVFPAVWGEVAPSEHVRKIEDPAVDEEWTVTRDGNPMCALSALQVTAPRVLFAVAGEPSAANANAVQDHGLDVPPVVPPRHGEAHNPALAGGLSARLPWISPWTLEHAHAHRNP